MAKILISACLAGVNCKYNGENNLNSRVLELINNEDVILVCPEQMGGLSTPRSPAEIKDGRLINQKGEDVTLQFEKGAQETLRLSEIFQVKVAVLKERSPSCGVNYIYDGSHSGVLKKGLGITARLLKMNGIKVISEEEIDKL